MKSSISEEEEAKRTDQLQEYNDSQKIAELQSKRMQLRYCINILIQQDKENEAELVELVAKQKGRNGSGA